MSEQNQAPNPVAAIITALVSLAVGAFIFFGDFSGSSADLRGTYKWDYNGYEQTIVISSKGEKGPCTWRGESGKETQESFIYYTHVSDRPQLYIRGIAYIDVKNRKVYSSDSDFDAHRNGRTCRITR